MDIYTSLLKVNSIDLTYPFNEKTKDNIEFTKNQLEFFYIKKFDKCLTKKVGGTTKNSILVLSLY